MAAGPACGLVKRRHDAEAGAILAHCKKRIDATHRRSSVQHACTGKERSCVESRFEVSNQRESRAVGTNLEDVTNGSGGVPGPREKPTAIGSQRCLRTGLSFAPCKRVQD